MIVLFSQFVNADDLHATKVGIWRNYAEDAGKSKTSLRMDHLSGSELKGENGDVVFLAERLGGLRNCFCGF